MKITIDRLKLLNLVGFKQQPPPRDEWFSRTTTFSFSCENDHYDLFLSQYDDVTYASIDFHQQRHYMERVTFTDMISFTEHLKKTIKYGKLPSQTNVIRKLLLTELIDDPTLGDNS